MLKRSLRRKGKAEDENWVALLLKTFFGKHFIITRKQRDVYDQFSIKWRKLQKTWLCATPIYIVTMIDSIESKQTF